MTGDAAADLAIIITSQTLHFVASPIIVIGATTTISGYRLFRTFRNERNIKLQTQHNLEQDRRIRRLELANNINPMWEKLGITEEEWLQLPEDYRHQVESEEWTTVPCSNCGKAVLVKHPETKVLCMSCDADQNGVVDPGKEVHE